MTTADTRPHRTAAHAGRRWAPRVGDPFVATLALAAAFGVVGVAFVLLGEAPSTLTGNGTDRVILAAATVAMGFVAGVAVLDPTVGLIAWLLTMPILNLARVQMAVGSLSATASTLAILAIATGLILDARRQGATDAKAPAGDTAAGARVAVGALTISAIAVLSTLANGAPDGWPVVIHGVLEPLAAAMIVLALRPGPSGIVRILGAIAASASIASVLAIYRLSHVAQTLEQAQAARGDFGHFIFYNVNIFGEILALALPIALAGLLVLARGRRRSIRVALGAAVLLLLVALYFTYSKGAWLGSLAGVGLVGFVAARGRRQRAGVVVAVALASLLIVPIPVYVAGFLMGGGTPAAGTPTTSASPGPGQTAKPDGLLGAYNGILGTIQGSNRLTSWDPTSANGQVSVHERVLAWRAAISMAVARPLVGVGAGQFGPQVAGAFRQDGATRDLNSAHNYLLNIAAELGTVVVLLVVAAFATALWRARRAYGSRDSAARFAGLAIAGAVVAFLVVGETTGADLYASYRVMNSDGILFALVIGAGLALRVRAQGQPDPGPG